jgi:hypothetical protein
MSSIFIHGAKTSPGPWHTERLNGSGPLPVDLVIDRDGTELARLTYPQGPALTPEQYRANRQLISNAPRLLAALVEYAFTLDIEGAGITPELAQLIQDCGGPDISSRIKKVDK